jgi:hypothetical protein
VGDLGINRMIILELILRCTVSSSGYMLGPVAGPWADGNNPLGSMKDQGISCNM